MCKRSTVHSETAVGARSTTYLLTYYGHALHATRNRVYELHDCVPGVHGKGST